MFFKPEKWALVLSGGGAKGLAHVGVLKYFEELGVKPSMVVGTSCGAIIGGFYSCGMGAKEIEDFILNEFNYKDYIEIFALTSAIPILSEILQFGGIIKNLFSKLGIDTGVKLHEKIKVLTKNKNFGEEEIPFFCNSVDIVNHRHIIHDKGLIADAIRASFAVPGFFTPYQAGEALLIDGGVYDNMPVFVPRERGIERVIAVNLNDPGPEKMGKISTGIDVVSESLFISSRITKRTGKNLPDIEIVANDGRGSTDFSNMKSMINLGYVKAAERSKEIKRAVFSPIERLVGKMRRKNS